MVVLQALPCPFHLTHGHRKTAKNSTSPRDYLGTITSVPRVSCSSTTSIGSERELRMCVCYDLHNELLPYKETWTWQKSQVSKKQALMENNVDDSDLVLILQHPPVYTLGTRGSEKFLKFSMANPPYDVYRTDRGGEVTYHGPGQVVMYPIINLKYQKVDLHWYLRSLEEVVIRALSAAFSLKATRVNGLTGVWVGDRKVAAIGIHVSKWITYHGIALNVVNDLCPFGFIVPCGIYDRKVGSISGILGASADCSPYGMMDIICTSLFREFSQVFGLDLLYKYENPLLPSTTSETMDVDSHLDL